jgi:hypothetical protein
MTIFLVCGKQGSGKTLWCSAILYDYYLQGKKIYSNIHLRFPYEKINYADIINCRLENAVVYLDEIQLTLPSRQSMKSSSVQICDSFLSMSSKKDLIIIGTTQFPQKVDVRFRTEADYNVLCEKFVWNGERWAKSNKDAKELKNTPVIIDVAVEQVYDGQISKIRILANKFYGLYDRYEIVNIEGLEEANEIRKAKIKLIRDKAKQSVKDSMGDIGNADDLMY